VEGEREPSALVALLRSRDERVGGRMRLSREVVEETDEQEDDRARNRAVAVFAPVLDAFGTTADGLSSLDSQALRFVPIFSGGDVVK